MQENENNSNDFQNQQTVPVFSSASAIPHSMNTQPFGQQSVVSSNSESQPIVAKSKKTPLSKEQILIFACVGLSVFVLIFLATTIFLATRSSSSGANGSTTEGAAAAVSELGFATNKIENASEDATYRLALTAKDNSGNTVVGVRLGNVASVLTLAVNWEFVNQYYGINVARNDNETFTIDFNKNVIDFTFGYPTNLSSDAVLLVLLDDGTVAYMPMAKAMQSRTIKSYGKLNSVSDAVKFYQAEVTESYETSATTLVQRVDGEIIDLRSRLLAIIGKDSQ